MKLEVAIKIMRLQNFITRHEEDDFDGMDFYEFENFIGDIGVELDEIMNVVANIKEVPE